MAEWMTDEEMRRAEVDAQNARTAEAGYECAVRVEPNRYEMPTAYGRPLVAVLDTARSMALIAGDVDAASAAELRAFGRSVERQTGRPARLLEAVRDDERAVRDATPRPSPAMPITLGDGTPVAVDFGSRMFADDAKLDAAIRSAEAARPDTLPPQRYAIEDWASEWATLGSSAFASEPRPVYYVERRDREVVAAMEAIAKDREGHPRGGVKRGPLPDGSWGVVSLTVIGEAGPRDVPIAEARAAWSRELRRRVDESEARRRLTNYGPIDDPEEA